MLPVLQGISDLASELGLRLEPEVAESMVEAALEVGRGGVEQRLAGRVGFEQFQVLCEDLYSGATAKQGGATTAKGAGR